MERIDIQNTEMVPRHYNLPHQEVCVKAGRCICDSKTGACASLHIPAADRARHVDQAVLFAEEIRQAVDDNKLIVYASKQGIPQSQKQIVEMKQENKKSTGSRKAARKRGNTSKE